MPRIGGTFRNPTGFSQAGVMLGVVHHFLVGAGLPAKASVQAPGNLKENS
jgi:hypothetical protein